MLPLTNNDLSQFRHTLLDGDVVEALSQFDSVEAALQQQESQERMYQTVARGTVARTSPSEQANITAQQLIDQTFTAEQARLSFNLGFMSFAGGNLSADQMAGRTEQVIEAHEQINATAEKLQDAQSRVALPPLMSLFGLSSVTSYKGGSVEERYSLENFGNDEIKNVSVVVEGYALSPSPADVGTVSDNETVSVTVSGATNEAGIFNATISANGDSVSDTVGVTITVHDKNGFIEQVLTVLDGLQSHVSNIEPGRGKNGLMNKLNTAEKHLNQIQNQLDRGRTPPENAINNKLEAVINELGAFANQVNGMTGSRLSQDQAGLFLHDYREAVGTLEQAIKADL